VRAFSADAGFVAAEGQLRAFSADAGFVAAEGQLLIELPDPSDDKEDVLVR
jgi:hypothetical protein